MARGDILRSFAAPSATPFGLGRIGHNLLAADLAVSNIAMIDPRTGTILRTMTTTAAPTDVVFIGRHIFWTDDAANIIRQAAVGPVATELRSFAAPGATPRGMSTDQRMLINGESAAPLIQFLDQRLGTILYNFAGGASLIGLDFDEHDLFTADAGANTITIRDIRTGTGKTVFTGPAAQPTGIVKFGNTLFIADNSTDTIYQVAL